MRNPQSVPLDRKQHAPRNCGKIKLLGPPETVLSLGENLSNVHIEGRFTQPAS